jgi:hypothetical protein
VPIPRGFMFISVRPVCCTMRSYRLSQCMDVKLALFGLACLVAGSVQSEPGAHPGMRFRLFCIDEKLFQFQASGRHGEATWRIGKREQGYSSVDHAFRGKADGVESVSGSGRSAVTQGHHRAWFPCGPL